MMTALVWFLVAVLVGVALGRVIPASGRWAWGFVAVLAIVLLVLTGRGQL